MICASAGLFAQEDIPQEEPTQETALIEESAKNDKYAARREGIPEGAIHTLDLIMNYEASFYLNPEYTELNSAPSPINFQLSLGMLWPNYTEIAVQPLISFFYMNHLWYEDRALPAEIENRTSDTLSFLVQVPAAFSLFLKNSRFQFIVGPAVMARLTLLARGVSPDATGYLGTASADINAINRWFWSDGRWFYATAGISWLYHITPQLRTGLTVNASVPVGAILKDKTAQGLLISTGIKICR